MTSQPVPRTTERLALAVMTFAVVAMVAYVAQRVVERVQGNVPDPLTGLAAPPVAFDWRAAIASWWGGLAAIVAYVVSARSRASDRALFFVAVCSVPATILHIVLSWLYP